MTIQVLGPAEVDLFKIVATINQLCQGRNNATGTVTLTASAATTVVQAPNCATGAAPGLTALTANAAAEFKNGTIYVSTIANGSFTITHANNGQTDRNYTWTAIG
jgi:hypothetical protein